MAEQAMALHERLRSPIEKLGEQMIRNWENAPASGSIADESNRRKTATSPQRKADPFATKADRTAARAKAQGIVGGKRNDLAEKLGTDRTRLNRWVNNRLADDKTSRKRDQIEAALLTISATSK
jgi:hypothetical protein